jgi:tellurium resistance protein TerD
MTGIVLTKGGRINLAKEAPSLTKVSVGLGWKPNNFNTGTDFDLDASVFICTNASGSAQLISNDYFVFYGKHTEPEGAVEHSGDSRNGTLNIDFGVDANGRKIEVDEIVTVDFTKLAANVDELSFIVTIHEADDRKQNFGQVSGSVIVLRDDVSGKILGSYSLEDDFSTETAVQFGSLYKKDGAWLFKAVGAGYNKGLADFVLAYGGTLA